MIFNITNIGDKDNKKKQKMVIIYKKKVKKYDKIKIKIKHIFFCKIFFLFPSSIFSLNATTIIHLQSIVYKLLIYRSYIFVYKMNIFFIFTFSNDRI